MWSDMQQNGCSVPGRCLNIVDLRVHQPIVSTSLHKNTDKKVLESTREERICSTYKSD